MTETTRRTGNWQRWGEDDERGALNLLTPGVVHAATRVCRTGKTYSLALPIQRDGVPLVPYRGAPMRMTLTNSTDDELWAAYGAEGTGANEDVLVLASHNETHMDALSHVFHEGRMYNGFPATGMRTHTGAEHLGIENVGCVAGRAVLLDLVRYLGEAELTDRVLSTQDLEGCAAAQGVAVRPGDILLLRTGWLERYRRSPGTVGQQPQPGLGMDAVRFVREHDVVAVGADNSAVEALPFDGAFLTVHIELLVKLGVYLLEHLVLEELARDQVYESLLVVAPLPVPGATGSPINPIAIG
ncbi:cyclase family protein [Amycolatopsis sp. GM8]|uniref:cyclase family protein n=1 Tax=Amycolatopsis sp. GM8 TaxID=2896530 RepID=UPI001F37859B|nr:cyclase family protein [Amycolatopsis sp. GM8]